MLLFFLQQHILSEIKLVKPNPSYNFSSWTQVWGYYDIEHTLNNQKTPITYGNSGVFVKFVVGDQICVPSNMTTTLCNGLILELGTQKVTDDDAYILYKITNPGEEEKTFSLGVYADFTFNTGNGNSNIFQPLEGQDIYTISASKSEKPRQKMAIDHTNKETNYIKPDNYWYGVLDSNDDDKRYFMKFEGDKSVVGPGATPDDDPVSSYSWENKIAPKGRTVVCAIRIYFIMRYPLEVFTDGTVFAGDLTGEIQVPTWMRIAEKYQPYDAYFKEGNGEWTKKLSFNGNMPFDRYTYKLNPSGTSTEYTYKLEYTKNGQKFSSNEVKFKVTRSTQPELEVTTAIKSQPYNQHDSLDIRATVMSDTPGDISIEIYKDDFIATDPIKEPYVLGVGTGVRDATYSKVLQLGTLRSGTYKLAIRAINNLGRSSEWYNRTFTMEFQTEVFDIHFEKKAYQANDIIRLLGQFLETDNNEQIRFALVMPDGSTARSELYTPTGARQDFVVTTTVSDETERLIDCTFQVLTSNNVVVKSQQIQLRITKAPIFTLSPDFFGKEFNNSQILSYKVTAASDEDTTSLKCLYKIDKNEYKEISWADYRINIPLTGLNWSAGFDHHLSIVAMDQYESTSKETTLDFRILNEPKLVSVQFTGTNIHDPFSTGEFVARYDDIDKGKQLYLYAKIGSDIQKFDFISVPEQNTQQITRSLRYPKPGKQNVVFFISSLSESVYPKTAHSNSNEVSAEIISTYRPEVTSLTVTRSSYYTSSDRIPFTLKIKDDLSGTIKYKIDDVDVTNLQNTLTTYQTPDGESYATVSTSIVIPSTCTYSNNKAHTLTAKVVDNYDLESSNSKSYTFYIRNVPTISVDELMKTLAISNTPKESDRTILISGTFRDVDNKPLKVFVQEEGGSPYECKSGSSNNADVGFSCNYIVQAESKADFPISIWVESVESKNDEQGKVKSEVVVKKITVTDPPAISSNCVSGSFGYEDPITIKFSVTDDSKGNIKFYLNKTYLSNQDYRYENFVGGESSATVKIPQDLPRGMYYLNYYPVDDYGVEALDKSRYRCLIEYKNKPKIGEVKLSKTSGDDDDEVSATIKYTDYDNEKKLYIYQKVGDHSYQVTGETQSNGGSNEVNVPVQGLPGNPSGQVNIYFILADTNNADLTTLQGNQKSNEASAPFTLNNIPTLEVTYDQVKSGGETFKINLKVTTEKSYTIYRRQNNVETYVAEYTGNAEYTDSVRADESVDSMTVYYYLKDNSGNTISQRIQIVLTVRNPPIISSFSSSVQTAKPGGKLSLTYGFDNRQNTKIFAFYKINNAEPQSVMFWTSQYPTSFSTEIQLPFIKSETSVTITGWLQNTDTPQGENPEPYTKSGTIPINIFLTYPPNVTLIFPSSNVFGNDDKIKISYDIVDETTGTIKAYINGISAAFKDYTSNGNHDVNSLSFKLPEEITYATIDPKIIVKVTDSHQETTDYTPFPIVVVNKPKITGVTFSQESGVSDGKIEATVEFDDFDVDKRLYVFVKHDDELLYPENNKIESSTGTSGQRKTITLFIPDTDSSSIEFKFFMTTDQSPSANEKEDNYKSKDYSKTLPITFEPAIHIFMNELKEFYQKGSSILIKGIVYADQEAIIKFYSDSQCTKQIGDQFNYYSVTSSGKEFEASVQIQPTMLYGYNTIYCKAFSRYNQESSYPIDINFFIKNKPIVSNPKVNKAFYKVGEDITGTFYLTDLDAGKPIFFFGRLEDGRDTELIVDVYESSGDENQEIPFTFKTSSTKTGNLPLLIWATDEYDSNPSKEISKSDPTKVDVKITIPPSMKFKYEGPNVFSFKEIMQIQVDIEEDENVTLSYYVDKRNLQKTEKIEINGKYSGLREFKISSGLSQGYHELSFTIFDNHGLTTTVPGSIPFTIKNRPNITDLSITKNFITQDEVVGLEGHFTDVDGLKPLYLFYQIDNSEIIGSIKEFSSQGIRGQVLKAGFYVDKDEPTGEKTLRVWLSSVNNVETVKNSLTAPSKDVSDKFELVFNLTYNPTVELDELTKQVYNDGESLTVTGTVHAYSDVVLTYFINSNKIDHETVVTVTGKLTKFSDTIVIPENYRYGNHSLNVVVSDHHDHNTRSLSTLKFTIRNPPRIISAKATGDNYLPGSSVTIFGKVRDPDYGNELSIRSQVDSGVEVPQVTLTSTAEEMNYEFSVKLEETLIPGKHTINVIVVDNDNEKSSPFPVAINVIPLPTSTPLPTNAPENNDNNNNANQGGSSASGNSKRTGLIVGIVIALLVLIALLAVLAFILLRKKSANAQAQDSESTENNDDIEQQETQISQTITSEEFATRDNPLFESQQIARDQDLFDNEFEEASL